MVPVHCNNQSTTYKHNINLKNKNQMKKLFAFSVVTMFVFIFSSCKKDYTCTCTYTNGSTNSTQLENLTKDDANAACNTLSLLAAPLGSCTL